MKHEGFKVVNVRIPNELAAVLQTMAHADSRSLTNLIVVILRDYVANKQVDHK